MASVLARRPSCPRSLLRPPPSCRTAGGALRTFAGRPSPEGSRTPLRIGLIGYGAIGEAVAAGLRDPAGGAALTALLVRRPRTHLPEALTEVPFTTDPDAFFAAPWAVCVEAAGQDAVRAYGERCLSGGRPLLVTSVGALVDDTLLLRLRGIAAASSSGARLLLASGALPAVDWMHAASLGGGASVTLRQVKPPAAWRGARHDPRNHAPLPDALDFDRLTTVTTVFKGSAREAAALYPRSANVAATLGLATVGLDATTVELVADPAGRMATEVDFRSPVGDLRVQVEGRPSATNPRTSAVVPLSVLRALRTLAATTVYGL